MKIDRDEVLLDIGYKSEGVIPSKELSIRHDVNPREVVKVGEHMEALVLQKEDKEGRLILSKKRAQYERAWGTIEEVMERRHDQGPGDRGRQGRPDPRHRPARVPARVARRPSPRPRPAARSSGTELECKIIELDRNRNNVVLRRRAFLEESQPRAARPSCRTCRRASVARAPSVRS